MKIDVLALDLEATLVDNALNATPRTGLVEFLRYCDANFDRVVLYTTVEKDDAREVVDELVSSGHWPSTLADRLEYVDWFGEFKDLKFISNVSPERTVLVDDDEAWIRPEQKEQWISIVPWNGDPDSELQRVQQELIQLTGDR